AGPADRGSHCHLLPDHELRAVCFSPAQEIKKPLAGPKYKPGTVQLCRFFVCHFTGTSRF
ncbi:hypothetical protein, partial [Gemmiger formicilis]|uniref:hypothetical protein n=1 Tax=Gemmiger formicilis TaxID=745368 RepID=UPI00195C789E